MFVNLCEIRRARMMPARVLTGLYSAPWPNRIELMAGDRFPSFLPIQLRILRSVLFLKYALPNTHRKQ